MAQQKPAPEPEGFRPIEVVPAAAPVDFKPIEVTPYQHAEVTPVAATQKPATGKED